MQATPAPRRLARHAANSATDVITERNQRATSSGKANGDATMASSATTPPNDCPTTSVGSPMAEPGKFFVLFTYTHLRHLLPGWLRGNPKPPGSRTDLR